MQNLYADLLEVLKDHDEYTKDGKPFKNVIVEHALKMQPKLLEILLSNEKLKEHFFEKVGDVLVFDKIKFQRFVNNKQFLPDSYTQFKNKIGLTANGEYLTESNEVVLSWPYKDCVLEGGQTKEDQKRKEIFWNETLAPDEIDRLFEPKLLTDFTRYDVNGKRVATDIEIGDNLFIKGNNLLVLHSLNSVYEGEVKLIYIDPPFNTGSDSFLYNDSFNHATWATFLRNRLQIAKTLLKDDGAIFVHLDDNEVAYGKVLCDEIFGRENYCNQIIIETNSAFGYKSTAGALFKQAGHLLFYCRNKSNFALNKLYIEKEYDVAYRFIFEDVTIPEAEWRWMDVGESFAIDKGFDNKRSAIRELGQDGFIAELSNYAIDNAERVFRTASVTGGAYKKRKETIERSAGERTRIIRHPNDDMDYMFIAGERVLFYRERLNEIDGHLVPAVTITDLWTDISIEGIANEGGVRFERGKKPEELLRRLIDLVTDEGDLVLDFFSGSGTTVAVAHKMKRRFIGVEQMDYVNTLPLTRLVNVINGDQSGISRRAEINWQGGGGFVYCELKQDNQRFIQSILNSESSDELKTIWKAIDENGFISYRIDPKSIDENVREFLDLSLDDQRRFLIEVLDKNQLYVNYCDVANADYEITDDEKKMNDKFYTLK